MQAPKNFEIYFLRAKTENIRDTPISRKPNNAIIDKYLYAILHAPKVFYDIHAENSCDNSIAKSKVPKANNIFSMSSVQGSENPF